MENKATNQIKLRDIVFAEPHPDEQQAHTAAALLADVQGVLVLNPLSNTHLQLSYDLRHVSLEIIENALRNVGFHLCNRLIYKLKRSLYYYTEENQRTLLGCARGNSNCTQKIFISRYDRISHGCRDQRPEHWRKYL